MKKKFDAVAVMREARRKLSEEWEGKPLEQEIEYFRRKYAKLKRKKKSV